MGRNRDVTGSSGAAPVFRRELWPVPHRSLNCRLAPFDRISLPRGRQIRCSRREEQDQLPAMITIEWARQGEKRGQPPGIPRIGSIADNPAGPCSNGVASVSFTRCFAGILACVARNFSTATPCAIGTSSARMGDVVGRMAARHVKFADNVAENGSSPEARR